MKNFNRIVLSMIALMLSTTVFAQSLNLTPKLENPSSTINDGVITVDVNGGVAPYSYRWTNPNTSLDSNTATGLVEGKEYTVVVEDAQGLQATGSYKVEAESITEIFNGLAVPAVDALGGVLFWDPFSAIGIYDPVVYAEGKNIPIPGWTVEDSSKYTLKQWHKPEGVEVEVNDLIATIVNEKGEEQQIYATAGGELKHLTKQGGVIYNPSNAEHVIEQGAHNLARINYSEKIPLTFPNGDVQTKGIPFIVIWLVFGAAFFTIRMGFINFRGFKHAIQLARGTYDDPNAPGEVTHFQALATAVSGTVGLGNIAGVAVAISLGGAGATFWIIVAGLLGMSSKFVECTLGVKYRYIDSNGRVFGGPMHYLRYGLAKRGKTKLGKVLAGLFAVLAVGASFGGGNMFQANQSFEALSGQFPVMADYGFIFGLVTAALVAIVIIGGIQSIAKVTGKIVPLMAGIYILASLIVVGMNIENIGPAFAAIIDGAFSPSAIQGGVIGVLIIGFQRAAFSNEAGVGSAAIAHSAAKTNNPPSEGFVALLEPFIDTVVVCTLTALVLIFTGKHEVVGVAGSQLTSDAFGSVISWFPYVLAAAIFLFAFSTMISWSYYGMRAWTYLFGKSVRSEIIYKVLFLVFVVVGASISLGAVLDFSDMMILAMSFPNIIGLYIMSGEVRNDLRGYLKKLRAGELEYKRAA